MTMNAKTLTTNLKYLRSVSGNGWSQGSIETRNGWLDRLISELE